MTPAEPAPGQLRRDLLPLRGRVARPGGRDQRRDRGAGRQDAAVWHQEADLPDPGAPSRLLESATATSRFLDILSGPLRDHPPCMRRSGPPGGSPASAGSPSSSAAAPSASASATSVSAALCSDVAALRGSLQELTSIRPSASAAAELRAAVQNVQSNLSDLSSAAGTLWSAQVQNLRSALTKLQSAVSTLATQRNASSVSGVVTAVGGVSAAARQLLDAASPSCPSPSASSG
jgi:hypothetical protein